MIGEVDNYANINNVDFLSKYTYIKLWKKKRKK
jgi:hypothetical protein